MKYLKTEQVIPNRGMSYTLYEIEGDDEIVRMLTAIPDDDFVSIYTKPPVKKLFAPERCEEASQDEFLTFWKRGEELKSSKPGG